MFLQHAARRSGVMGRFTCSVGRTTMMRSRMLLPVRTMSAVRVLADHVAVVEFRELNSKSVWYFTANWCGPCKQIKPVYEELSQKYNRVAFGKVDVDEWTKMPTPRSNLKFKRYPFVAFDGDEAVHRFSGADSNQLESLVQEL